MHANLLVCVERRDRDDAVAAEDAVVKGRLHLPLGSGYRTRPRPSAASGPRKCHNDFIPYIVIQEHFNYNYGFAFAITGFGASVLMFFVTLFITGTKDSIGESTLPLTLPYRSVIVLLRIWMRLRGTSVVSYPSTWLLAVSACSTTSRAP